MKCFCINYYISRLLCNQKMSPSYSSQILTSLEINKGTLSHFHNSNTCPSLQ